jgi:hypothetical protein
MIGLIAITIIIPLVIIKIYNFYANKKEDKFAREHPDYINFCKQYEKLADESRDIWNPIIPDCRREIEYCLKEMNYYPIFSEQYHCLHERLNATREKNSKYEEEYNMKKREITKFVKDNKDAIESIREDEKELYNDWITRFDLG